MRKIIGILTSFLLLIFIFGKPVLAQEATSSSDTQDVLGVQTVDYTLAYPGLLPDNPLYPLKALRDKIVGFLIADPIKKAEFDVLQADKRLEASWMLYQKRPLQENLVIDTLAKGENYFAEGIDQVTFAKKQGQVTTDILGTMETSNKKHLEIINDMQAQASGELRGKFAQQKSRVEKLGKLVNSLQAKQ